MTTVIESRPLEGSAYGRPKPVAEKLLIEGRAWHTLR